MALVIAGVALSGLGLRAADGGRRPLDLLGAIMSGCGVIAAAAGVVTALDSGFGQSFIGT